MKAPAAYRWFAVFLAFSVGLALLPGLTRTDDWVPTENALIDLYGYPFLIPQAYFRGHGKSGSQSELALIASLPGVGMDGKRAQDEWKDGAPRLLRFGVFPASLYTKMSEGKLYPEQVIENLITLFDRNRDRYDSFPDIDFAESWEAFLQEHGGQEGRLLNATHLLGWDSIGTPPEEAQQTVDVVVLDNQVVLFQRCDTPPRLDQDYSPLCKAYFQGVGDVFAIQFSYKAIRKQKAFEIAQQISQRLKAFNEAAIQASGTGKRAY